MNPLYKNLALWLVISLMMVLLFNFFSRPEQGSEKLPYSDFLAAVEKGQVTSVEIQGNEVRGWSSDGQRFRTYAPDDPKLISDLRAKDVRINVKPADRLALVHDRPGVMVPHDSTHRRVDILHAPDADGRGQGHELWQEPGASANRTRGAAHHL